MEQEGHDGGCARCSCWGGALSLGRSDIDDLDDVVRSYELKQRQLIQELLPQQLDSSAAAGARSPENGSEGGSMTM